MTPFPWLTNLDKFLAMVLASYLVAVEDLRSGLEELRRDARAPFENGQAELGAFCDYLVEHQTAQLAGSVRSS